MTLNGLKRACGIWAENMDASRKALVPREYQRKVLEIFDKGERFAVVCGASRTGKSWILSGIANDMIEQAYDEADMAYEMDRDAIRKARAVVQYMTFFEFELMLREAQTKGELFGLFSQLLAPKVLIVDEYGRGKWSDFTATFFQNLLIKRYGEKKRTMIGSNLTQSELVDMLDIALLERLGADNIGVMKNY